VHGVELNFNPLNVKFYRVKISAVFRIVYTSCCHADRSEDVICSYLCLTMFALVKGSRNFSVFPLMTTVSQLLISEMMEYLAFVVKNEI
jgi:hypothetical protein